MNITAFELAQRYVGIAELGDRRDHPLIQWWLSLCGFGTDAHDEVPWCAAFCNGIAWELRLPRSKSAMARSWLAVGVAVEARQAQVGWDLVILQRGSGQQPGPEDLTAPGHVGWFAGIENGKIMVLGGNQSNMVSIQAFPYDRVLGIRRLRREP